VLYTIIRTFRFYFSLFTNIKTETVTDVLFCCCPPKSRHGDVWGNGDITPTFLTSALDGGVWSDSRPSRLTPRCRNSCTHWVGGWLGTMEKIKLFYRGAKFHISRERTLNRISVHKREKVTGRQRECTMRSFLICTAHYASLG
jgi:hypothetical protein